MQTEAEVLSMIILSFVFVFLGKLVHIGCSLSSLKGESIGDHSRGYSGGY